MTTLQLSVHFNYLHQQQNAEQETFMMKTKKQILEQISAATDRKRTIDRQIDPFLIFNDM